MNIEHANRYIFAAQKLKALHIANPIVIDAASGQGYGAKIIKELVPNAKIIGYDHNPKTLEAARRKYGSYGTYVWSDVRHIPTENAKADMTTAFETLEHLPSEDQPKFLQELKRITKPGGLIVLSVPYPSSTYRDKNNKIHRGFGSGYHLYEPTADEMKSMITSSGLKIVGEYGQAVAHSKRAKTMSRINRVVPIWSLYAWFPALKRDHSVQPMPEQPNLTSLIRVFIVKSSI